MTSVSGILFHVQRKLCGPGVISLVSKTDKDVVEEPQKGFRESPVEHGLPLARCT